MEVIIHVMMCSCAGVPVNIPCNEMMGTADGPGGCKIAAAVAAAKAASVRLTRLHLHRAYRFSAQSSAANRRRWLCCAWERRRRMTRAMPLRMKGQIVATSRCPPHRLSSHAPSLRTPKRDIAGFFLRLRESVVIAGQRRRWFWCW